MGRRRKGDVPEVRITSHGGREYARLRIGQVTHYLGAVYGQLSSHQAAKAAALIRNKSTCCVYVISDGHGNFKIGVTQDVQGRVAQLQVGNASLLFAVHCRHFSTEEDALRCESYCHSALYSRAIRGEWFRCSLWEAVDVVSGFTCDAEAVA